MKKYRNLLFDLDHTLWDFDRNSKVALNELYDEFDLNRFFYDFDSFIDVYHRINSKMWSLYGRGKITKKEVKYGRFIQSFEKVGCKDRELALAFADEYVRRSPCKTFLIPGALEAVQSLFGSYNLYIITNGFNEVQFKKIRLSGLEPFFIGVFTSEDAGFQKPEHGFFEYIFQKGRFKTSDCIVIGDNLITDIGGAKSFGIDTVFYNPKSDKDFIGSDYMINSMAELLSLI